MAPIPDSKAGPKRALLVGVQTPDMPDGEADELLLELQELVENLHFEVVDCFLVNFKRTTPAFYTGQG